jgi:hypothetical protein
VCQLLVCQLLVCQLCVSTVCVSGVCQRCVSAVCVSCVCVSGVCQRCVSAVCVSFVCQWCVSAVYVCQRCVSAVCVNCVCNAHWRIGRQTHPHVEMCGLIDLLRPFTADLEPSDLREPLWGGWTHFDWVFLLGWFWLGFPTWRKIGFGWLKITTKNIFVPKFNT